MTDIEDAKAFITDAYKAKENWQKVAERSWNEIKKRSQNNKMWAMGPYSGRRQRARYPAWCSIFNIRKPLLLSRVGIPIGKDMSQDGNDNIGATAAILRERLAVGLARSFPMFDVMADCRDDFLATNFSTCRGYYERDEVKQRVKERLQPQQDPESGQVVFYDAEGLIVEGDVPIQQDDEGYFMELEQVVDVQNEKICLEPILYREIYIDPGVRRWQRCKRLAFAEYYSVQEFKDIFGTKAYIDLSSAESSRHGGGDYDLKHQAIKVFEYWDDYDKDVKWFAENGPDFIKPKDYYFPEDEDGDEYDDGKDLNGLYNLEGFFPCVTPLIINAPTDEFWPIPEYYQVVEILEDIHTIFGRMIALTRAIRARLLFDNNVDGLQAALNEAAEGDAFGVPNLAQSLSAAGGNLDSVVQYIPVAAMVDALAQVYQALEQRLMSLFKLTGTSDLLQGLTTTESGKTLGERQMEEKYAINQIAEMQRKMAEFVRDSYQLMTEMALKNFKDSSLDIYIMPQTLSEDHRSRYRAALGMLKNDQKRFRIELETDSTIALNENYDKQMRVELVNTLTNALEKAGDVARTSPALIVPTLHAMKFLIQGFRQGKLFQNEMTQAIDNVIKQAQDTPAPFNKEQVMAEIEQKKLDSTNEKDKYKILSDEKIAIAKLNQDARLADLQSQIEQFKVQSQAAQSQAELQLAYNKLSSDITLAQEGLAAERDKLYVEMQKISSAAEAKQFANMIDERVATYEAQLGQAQLQLDQYRVTMDEQEKWATEGRLQSEHQLEQVRAQMDIQFKAQQMQLAAEQALLEAQPKQPPVNVTIEAPKPTASRKKLKIERDELGNVKKFDQEETSDPVDE